MCDADLIIVGAGPAGMAAAATAAKSGAKVLLLDEQPRAGGQIYRNVGVQDDTRPYLGKDYAAGRPLVEGLDAPGITTEFGATVWRIEAGPRVVWSRDGVSRVCQARHVLLAGGAQERPMPFPGWTLPGVMPAGAAQILMKSAGLLPRDSVLAGSGPLLYLIAAQMIDAGAPPQALGETQTSAMMLRASGHLPRAFLATRTLLKGLGLLCKIKAAGVARHTASTGFSRIDAQLSDSLIAQESFLSTDEGADYAFLGGDHLDVDCYGEGVGIAVRKGDDALRDTLSAAITAIRETGTYAAINGKYFPFDIYGGRPESADAATN